MTPTRTPLSLILGLAMVPHAPAATDRTVQVEVTAGSSGIDITWTPRSALPGEYRLFPGYRVEVSTNLVDWESTGHHVPQRVGGEAARITVSITNTTPDRLFVRVVDRLELHRDWFLRLLDTRETVDLRGADLRGASLDDLVLAGGLLFDGANLSGATIRRAAFGYASFRGADFTGANVLGASFYGTELTDANFTRVDARGATFGAANMQNLNLQDANLLDARAFDDTVPGMRFLNTVLPDGTVRTD